MGRINSNLCEWPVWDFLIQYGAQFSKAVVLGQFHGDHLNQEWIENTKVSQTFGYLVSLRQLGLTFTFLPGGDSFWPSRCLMLSGHSVYSCRRNTNNLLAQISVYERRGKGKFSGFYSLPKNILSPQGNLIYRGDEEFQVFFKMFACHLINQNLN